MGKQPEIGRENFGVQLLSASGTYEGDLESIPKQVAMQVFPANSDHASNYRITGKGFIGFAIHSPKTTFYDIYGTELGNFVITVMSDSIGNCDAILQAIAQIAGISMRYLTKNGDVHYPASGAMLLLHPQMTSPYRIGGLPLHSDN